MGRARLSSPILVQDAASLQAAVSRLAPALRLAIDTESNSLHSYRERVCLIQISVPQADYLLDPLALADLKPLAPLLENPRTEKVFHAAEYDLLCLKRDFGFKVNPLFDTHLASRTLGRKKTGLGDLLEEEFGVHLDKRLQRANWGKRPLPADLLNYARLDTHYLLDLRDVFEKALKESGRWDEAQEAFELLSRVTPHSNGFDPDGFWNIAHASRLGPVQAAVLRELYHFREDQARRMDRPSFKVMGDRTLLAAAQALPQDLKGVAALPGMSQGQVERFGNSILSAVQRGRKAPRPARRPTTPPVEEVILNRFEKLRRWRQRAARARQVESDVILPREILWKIAREGPKDLTALHRSMSPLEWRHRTYGPEILGALWD